MNTDTEALVKRGEKLIWTVLNKLNKLSVDKEEIRTPKEWRRDIDMKEMCLCLALFEQHIRDFGVIPGGDYKVRCTGCGKWWDTMGDVLKEGNFKSEISKKISDAETVYFKIVECPACNK